MLLPKLQGVAGDYGFDELDSEEHSNYKTLMTCLKLQFHKVESAKSYAATFWKRDQKATETEEAYATELKRMYGKAYSQWDSSARAEDCYIGS